MSLLSKQVLKCIPLVFVVAHCANPNEVEQKLHNGSIKCWEIYTNRYYRSFHHGDLSTVELYESVDLTKDGKVEYFIFDRRKNSRKPKNSGDRIPNRRWELLGVDSIKMFNGNGKIYKITEDTLILHYKNDTIGLSRCGCSPLSPMYKKD